MANALIILVPCFKLCDQHLRGENFNFAIWVIQDTTQKKNLDNSGTALEPIISKKSYHYQNRSSQVWRVVGREHLG